MNRRFELTDQEWERLAPLLESWTGTPRSTAASSGPTSTPPAPAKGARLDPGKPPASAGALPRWA